MIIPLSWLREYVDIDIPVEALAERLTNAGLEVAHLTYIGVPQTQVEGLRYPKSNHLVWDRERILLGLIREVTAHPNADRLVIAHVDLGGGRVEACVTGAPNLFEFKGAGPIEPPLWTAFASEGAEVWDGHSETPKRMILKEKALRGVPNKHMVCSDKELGISDEHDGVILMREAPRDARGGTFAPGTPLADVLGDVLLEIELTPNLARALSVFGVAREVAALLDVPLRPPSYDVVMEGAAIDGQAFIDIRQPDLNPRFTLALLRGVTIQPSPEWMQRRLRLVGQRPINNIVDVTNYITFEIGQPLHAFDYDKLAARAGGGAPTIITRLPEPGETLETLDQVKRTLEPHTILVCDTAGALSLGGVIGGAETEISDTTTTVLLEAAAWNFINIRRTMQSQKVFTDAATRFSRGVHPSQALLGVRRGIELMRQTGGGQVAQGIIDSYPAPPPSVHVTLTTREIERIMGMTFSADEAAAILRRGGFTVAVVDAATLAVTAPDDRLDISADPITGQADLIEEIARIHGYETIPQTIIADMMPQQRPNPDLDREELARDVLVGLGLREQISYRMTTPAREKLLVPPGMASSLPTAGYVELANPIAPEKSHLRHTVLISLLENAVANQRYAARQAAFEIGSVYLAGDQPLPDEPRRLGILLMGERQPSRWTNPTEASVDFYDLKGIVEGLLAGLHIGGATFSRAEHTSFHPGRSALLTIAGRAIGPFGELHPQVTAAFELKGTVLVAEFDLDALLSVVNPLHTVRSLPLTPPVLQDIALVVPDSVPAAAVETVIRKAGGDLLRGVRLFDVYTGDPIPAGSRSLAFSLTYQTDDRTLTDKEVARVHEKIVKACERELNVQVRK